MLNYRFTVTTAVAPGGVRNYLFKLQPTGVKKTNKAAAQPPTATQFRSTLGDAKKEAADSAGVSTTTPPDTPKDTSGGHTTSGDSEIDPDDNDALIGHVDVIWCSGLGEKARRRIPLPCKVCFFIYLTRTTTTTTTTTQHHALCYTLRSGEDNHKSKLLKINYGSK